MILGAKRRRRWTGTAVFVAASIVLSATAAADPTTGVRVVDTFDRPDGGSLGVADTGQAWSVAAGSWSVIDGAAQPSTSGYALALVDGGASTGVVSATLAAPGSELWLVLRAADGANYWRFGRWQDGAYQLQQVTANALGSPRVSVLDSVAPAAGDQLACELRSPGLRCSVNGAPVVETDDGFNGSATSVGFAAYGSPGLRFDDLRVEDLRQAADLAVGIEDVDPVPVGGTARWTVTVRNVGVVASGPVSLGLALPAGLSVATASPSVGSCSLAGCELGVLGAGAAAEIVVEGVADEAGGLTLSVAATSPGVTNPGDDRASETTTVQPPPRPGARVVDGFDRPDAGSLGVADTGQPWSVLHGTAAVADGVATSGPGYTLAVLDGGGADAIVTMRVAATPPELWMVVRGEGAADYWRFGRWQNGSYQLQQIAANGLGSPPMTVFASPTPEVGDVLSCRAAGSSLECSVDGTPVVAATTAVDADAVHVGFAAWDPSGSAPARFDELTVADVPAVPAVSVSLDDVDPVVIGGTLRWTATVANTGTRDATDVTVDLALPAGIAPTVVSTTHGTCVGTTCDLGAIVAGAVAAVGIEAPAPTQPGVLEASASVTASGDGNPADDHDTETTWVRPPPAPGDRVVDGFDRTGESLGVSDTGQPWTELAGGFTTAGGVVAATTSQPSVAVVDPGWAYGTYEVTVADVGDGRFAVVFRVEDAFNYFRVAPDPTTGLYRLDRVVNGVAQPVAISIRRADVVAADGDRIRIVHRPDDGMFVSVNGIHVADAGDPAAMAVGRFGFVTSSTSPRIDHVDVGQVLTTGVLSGDAFDRPDSQTLGQMTTGTHYAYFPSAWMGWGITDGHAYQSTGGYGTVYVDTSSEMADVRVTVTQVSDEFAVAFRYDELDSSYIRFGRLHAGDAYDVDLIEGWSGGPVPVPVERLATVHPAAGDVLEVRQHLDGRVECLVNGLLVLRFTDTVTNPRSTLYGFASLGTVARFDDLIVTPE